MAHQNGIGRANVQTTTSILSSRVVTTFIGLKKQTHDI